MNNKDYEQIIVDEKKESRKKSILNREDREAVRRTVKKVISITRAGLELYFAARKKDPITLSLGLLSTYDALENILAKEGETLHQKVTSMGYYSIVRGMEKLVFDTFKDLHIPYEVRFTEPGGAGVDRALLFDIHGTKIFIIVEGTYISGVYAKDENKFIESFSKLLAEKLGKIVAVNVFTENWVTNIKLSSIDIPLETYVSTVDEKQYCDNIRKFREMGLNRSTLLFGNPGCGKAQPLDALVLTPSGFVEMRNIDVGTDVLTPSGNVSKVIGVFPQGEIDIYRVNFSDGTSTECCKEHLWLTSVSKDRRKAERKNIKTVKSLSEVMSSLRVEKDNRLNHSIPMVDHIDLNNGKELPLDPYILGVLIGDGCLKNTSPTISSSDDFIINAIKDCASNIGCKVNYVGAYDYRIVKDRSVNNNKRNNLYQIIEKLGLLGSKANSKFVPQMYKFSTFKNRLEILRGLMDTDGSIDSNVFRMEFCSASDQLALDVKFLVESLGGRATISNTPVTYKYRGEIRKAQNRNRVEIYLPPTIIPFKLERKIKVFEKMAAKSQFRPRYIENVEYIGKKEAKCILIDHPEHLYITNNFIVTHNTTFAAKVADNLNGRLVIVDAQALNQASRQGWSLTFQKILRLLSPTVILFDDIDRMGEEDLGFLLSMIENLNKFKDSGEIIIMASINDLTQLPDAMKRPGRFDEIVLFEDPDYNQRRLILVTYLNHFKTRLADMYVDEMAELSSGLSPAYLKEIAQQATVASYDRIPKVIAHMKAMLGLDDDDVPEPEDCDDDEDEECLSPPVGSSSRDRVAHFVKSVKKRLGDVDD